MINRLFSVSLVALSARANTQDYIYTKCVDANTIQIDIPYHHEAQIVENHCIDGSFNGSFTQSQNPDDFTISMTFDKNGDCPLLGENADHVTFKVGKAATSDDDLVFLYSNHTAYVYCDFVIGTYTVTYEYDEPLVIAQEEFHGEGEGDTKTGFFINSYHENYIQKIDEDLGDEQPKIAGERIYLGLEANRDFNHDDYLFVPTECTFKKRNSSIEYNLFKFNNDPSSCSNDIIGLELEYHQSYNIWQISHRLFLLDSITDGEYDLECEVAVCDATQNSTSCSILADTCGQNITNIPQLYEFETHTFTTCGKTFSSGATQAYGPSLQTCKDSYSSSAEWVEDYLIKSSVGGHPINQTWIVPKDGIYEIEARGAQGGYYSYYGYTGGKGAVITGNFSLKKGDAVQIVVGQRGGCYYNSGYGCGGGGGTFVVNAPYDDESGILVIAGGGGGAGQNGYGTQASVTTASQTDNTGCGTPTEGQGGIACGNYGGSSGGGFYGDGASNAYHNSYGYGFSYVSGGAIGGHGGGSYSNNPDASGGVGGGGAGSWAPGGGGGYTGGNGRYSGGSSDKYYGGGGGSYNADPNAAAGTTHSSYNGQVTVKFIQ